MTITLYSRNDITVPHFAAVAWQGDSVRLGADCVGHIDACRASFLQLLKHEPDLTVYGVTSGYGQKASQRLPPEERLAHAQQPPFASMSGFGGDLPERLKRGIVFARLANLVSGHAAVSSDLVQAVIRLLEQPLPRVPLLGNTSAGEIIPLSHLFTELWMTQEFSEKEVLALINGSPCAAALMTDIALAAEARLTLAMDVFALSAAAMNSPAEHYSEALEALYGDPAQSAVLQGLRARLVSDAASEVALNATSGRTYQAPVSFRVVPRVLGQAYRAHHDLVQGAALSLRAVTDNPVYMPPDETHPNGQVLSNGGFHNALACPSMDQMAGSYADLALLCDKQVTKLMDGQVSRLPHTLQAGDGYLGCLGFIAADYAEQARKQANRTALLASDGGAFGQNDVLIPLFHAWRQAEDAGRCLDACLAALAVTASQAFYASEQSGELATGQSSEATSAPASGRASGLASPHPSAHPSARVSCPAPLEPLLEEVRFYAPPLSTSRAMGLSVGDVANRFTQRVYRQCTVDHE